MSNIYFVEKYSKEAYKSLMKNCKKYDDREF